MDLIVVWLPLALGFSVGLLGFFVWVLNENMQYTVDQTNQMNK